ncbi:MAG: hypothetical protein LBR74_01520 [Eubacterium sp.]|jgi:hypothetical protein|nr:hypothetical protein [Eubacterium sp.]
MDKRNFYKQLMSEYTFDQEKIRRNAKRDNKKSMRALNSKWLPLASAAAVFVAVFLGYMAMNNGHSPDIVRPIEKVATPGDRIMETEIKILMSDDSEQSDMYLSFDEPLTLSEIGFHLGTLSDTGEVETLLFYDNQTEWFVEKEDIYDGQTFSAVKISSPINLLSDIRALRPVVFVDLASDSINDKNFTPLTKKEVDDATISGPPIQTAVSETTATSIVSDAVEPVETTGAKESSGDEPDNSSGVIIPEEPELPPIEMTVLSLQAEGVDQVEFINDDHFLALTSQSVDLYHIVSEPQRDFELIANHEIKNPKISNINYDEGVFIITGEDIYDVRNKLFVANGSDCSIVAVEMALYDSSITYSYYQEGAIISKVKSFGYESFYYSTPDENGGYKSRKLCDFEIQAPLLNVDQGKFIYALSDDEESSLFEFDIASGKITPLNFSIKGKSVFIRSANLTNFAALSPDGTWIYNASIKSFIEFKKGTRLEFSKSDFRYFIMDDEGYMIDGNEIISSQLPADDNNIIISSLYTVFSISETDVKIQVN